LFFEAGQRLRALREQLGLTLRQVEEASAAIAQAHQSDEFNLPLSRLSEIETKGLLPSIHRLYTLSAVYRADLHEILEWYGIELGQLAKDMQASEPPRSHLSKAISRVNMVSLPVQLDPGFDIRRTSHMGRMIQSWGVVPMAFLAGMADSEYSYGFIGVEDLTMYPLVMPGSFLQIDERRNKVVEGQWRSEYERPIYFVEMREGFACSWCKLQENRIVLQPHPLSPAAVRDYKYPQDAEILGQVVGVAMHFDDLRTGQFGRFSSEPRALRLAECKGGS
jgi:transcriptional regulator with XRE-family HTH domain